MAIVNRQAVVSGEQFESESKERDMTDQVQMRGAARFILQKRSALLGGLRLLPVAELLIGVATMAPAASATSCYQPSNIAVNGGRVSNETTLDLSADGGVAVSTADGGNGNAAAGGPGGLFGNGGDAEAGNAGVAVATANGGMIDLDDINSGNNRGNTVVVNTGSSPCHYGPSNVAINGGTVSNETTLQLSADGGTAVSSANGGNGNAAAGGAGGVFGDGGDAAAGNGGTAVAEANGGAVTIGDINSGGNSGNTIVVQGTQGGNVAVDGGTVTNETTIDISANGGTAVSTADGGDGNVAVAGSGGDFGN